MVNVEKFPIEVAYATAEDQTIISVKVTVDTTIQEAIIESGILQRFPDINLDVQSVGIFSQKANLSDKLNPYDRIEIYRPLKMDPKEARRLR